MTLGGGTMIGAGIFILPGLAAEGAGPASSVSFGIAGFVALLAALSLAELATGMPIAGGSYHYVNRALGGLFGSIVGWGMWTGLMFASAFYMIGFGQYIVVPLPFLDGRALIVLIGLVGLAAITGLNYYGTDESSGAQNLMIGAELIVVLAYVAVGVFFIEPGNLAEFAPTGPVGIVATTGTVFVTYLGFEIIATVAGEIEDPGRLIPLTMVLSVVSVTILYVVIMLVSTGVVPYQQLGSSFVPVSDVAAITMGGAIGVAAVTVAAAVAAISSSNSSILAASRVIYAMGRDGLMSDRLNVTHDRFATPHRAIIATGGVTGLLVLAGLQVAEIVALLAQVASFSFLVTYALVHVALVVFRRVDPEPYDPEFKIPGVLYPAVPILGVVMAGVVISQMQPEVIVVGIGIVALGVVWYGGYARSRTVEDGLLGEAVRIAFEPGGIAFETVGGLFGQAEPSDATADAQPYRVVVPVANPTTQRRLLRLAAATARAHADDGEPELVAVHVTEARPSPDRNVESDRLDEQRDLLTVARGVAAEIGIDLDTRSAIADDPGEVILEVIRETDAEQVVLGWQGVTDGDDDGEVFGSTLDSVIERAPCDVALVEFEQEMIGEPVALVDAGPHAATVAQRAVDFATVDGETATLLTVQRSTDDADPVREGRRMIEWVANRANLDSDEYETEVVVSGDLSAAIIDAVTGYDTVCVGLSERSDAERLEFGSTARRVSRDAPGNVAVVRGRELLEPDGPDRGLADVTAADDVT
ncbi:amino acid transporter [Haloglomus irregulare]|uniref:Amino acid transporter n=1 Tax=Haloglomus irregulare TaxID=2234134 RepID=A0A554MU15_9EURY|nr:amino acid transporter [Haloglomus irregulare]